MGNDTCKHPCGHDPASSTISVDRDAMIRDAQRAATTDEKTSKVERKHVEEQEERRQRAAEDSAAKRADLAEDKRQIELAEAKRQQAQDEAERREAESKQQEEAQAPQAALVSDHEADDLVRPSDESADANPEAEAAPEPFQDRMFRTEMAKLPQSLPTVQGSRPRRPSSENISLDAYLAKHAAEFEKLLELEQPDGWQFKKEQDGVKAYTKMIEGQPLFYFKGVTEFVCEKGVMDLVTAILTTEDRPKWDEMCATGGTPEGFPPFYKYAVCTLKAQHFIISARDLVTLGRMRFEHDGAVSIYVSSAEHPDAPETSKHVRISFIEGGYVIRPTSEPTKFTVTWTGCVDPKGMIPLWLANLVVVKQALTLAKIKQYIKKS